MNEYLAMAAYTRIGAILHARGEHAADPRGVRMLELAGH